MSREAFDEMAAEPTPALIARMRAFESDHAPGGWPCIRMRDITALCDAIEAARAAALEEAARVCHHKYMELRHGVDRTDPTDDYEYGLREEIAVELREAIRALKEK